MDFSDKRGVSGAAAALVVIALVGIAVGAYYYVTAPSSNNSTTSTSTTRTTSANSSTQSTTSNTTTTSSRTTSSTSNSTSSTSSTSISTSTCASTTGSTTSTSVEIQASVIPLFRTLSGLAMRFNGTSGGSSFDLASSYGIIGTSTSGGVTTYKVLINSTVDGGSQATDTAWVDSNGNVIAVEQGGSNVTGSLAASIFVGLMAPYVAETQFDAQISAFTGAGFTQTGTAQVAFGPTTMTVTNYEATSLPVYYNYCGNSETITAFSLQAGTVPETSLSLVTHLRLQVSSSSGNSDVSVQVTSITKA